MKPTFMRAAFNQALDDGETPEGAFLFAYNRPTSVPGIPTNISYSDLKLIATLLGIDAKDCRALHFTTDGIRAEVLARDETGNVLNSGNDASYHEIMIGLKASD